MSEDLYQKIRERISEIEAEGQARKKELLDKAFQRIDEQLAPYRAAINELAALLPKEEEQAPEGNFSAPDAGKGPDEEQARAEEVSPQELVKRAQENSLSR